MKILCVTEALQHPAVGGSTRSYHLLKQLSVRHTIELLTIDAKGVPAEVVADIRGHLQNLRVVATLPAIDGPASRVERRRAKVLAVERLGDALREAAVSGAHDLVLLHGASIAPVVEGLNRLPLVIDVGDANSSRLLASLRYTRLSKWPWLWRRYRGARRLERSLLRRSPHLAFLSCRDRDALVGRRRDAPIVPNGVDLSFWTRRAPRTTTDTLVFTGVLSYRPNEDGALYLVEQIVPRVRRSIPRVEVVIVGPDPTPALLASAAGRRDVVVTGRVEDVRPYLERAALFVAPVRFASGTQNKVLEALAMELPVVCTSTVARGISFDDLEHPPVRVADRAGAFAAAVVHLLRDDAACASLAARGRDFVAERFDWAESARVLEAICAAAVNGRRAGASRREERPDEWAPEGALRPRRTSP